MIPMVSRPSENDELFDLQELFTVEATDALEQQRTSWNVLLGFCRDHVNVLGTVPFHSEFVEQMVSLLQFALDWRAKWKTKPSKIWNDVWFSHETMLTLKDVRGAVKEMYIPEVLKWLDCEWFHNAGARSSHRPFHTFTTPN